MSVSQIVKKEIVNGLGELSPCCKVAFLSAVFRSAGSLVINSEGYGVAVSGENRQLILLVKKIVGQMYGCDLKMEIEPNPLKGKNVYSITIKDLSVLKQTGIVFFDNEGTKLLNGIDPYLVSESCCQKSFLKGLFLGCGTITLPTLKSLSDSKKSSVGYHLEFELSSPAVAHDLYQLLLNIGLSFKTATRGEKTVVYVKDSGNVSDTLAYLNADKAVMELQNLLIQRTIRNNANRQSNCITANIDKSVVAAEKQLADIELILQKKGENFLSTPLEVAAKARLGNPSASMEELAVICKISKSGLNHRMKRIANIALKIQ